MYIKLFEEFSEEFANKPTEYDLTDFANTVLGFLKKFHWFADTGFSHVTFGDLYDELSEKFDEFIEICLYNKITTPIKVSIWKSGEFINDCIIKPLNDYRANIQDYPNISALIDDLVNICQRGLYLLYKDYQTFEAAMSEAAKIAKKLRTLYRKMLTKYEMSEIALTQRDVNRAVIPPKVQTFMYHFAKELKKADIFDPRFDDYEAVIAELDNNTDRILLNAIYLIYFKGFRWEDSLRDKFDTLDWNHSNLRFIHPDIDVNILPQKNFTTAFNRLISAVLSKLETTISKFTKRPDYYIEIFKKVMSELLDWQVLYSEFQLDLADFKNNKRLIDQMAVDNIIAKYINMYLIATGVIKAKPSLVSLAKSNLKM